MTTPKPSPPQLEERCLSSHELLRGRLLHVLSDEVQLPDGSHSVREYVRHPGAAMVVPLLEGADGTYSVVLERQFRYPIGQVMIEFPAGKRDGDESTRVCAVRELREETGYTATHWAFAGTLHPLIAYSTEQIDVWFAKGLQLGTSRLDEGEFLEVFIAPVAQLLEWCRNGTVTDGKTISGAFWLQSFLHGELALQWQDA